MAYKRPLESVRVASAKGRALADRDDAAFGAQYAGVSRDGLVIGHLIPKSERPELRGDSARARRKEISRVVSSP